MQNLHFIHDVPVAMQHISRFVPVAEIDRRYFENPYYLVPDGKVAMEPFRVIQKAITQEGLVGIATLVMSNRERVVALEPRDGGIIVNTLRSPEELRDYKPLFEEIDDKPLDKEMIKLATHLISKMTGKFDPTMFQDRYQAALQEIITAKLKGVKPKMPKPAHTAEVVNLFDALKKSVAETGKKPAAPRRAGGDQRAKRASPKRAGKRRLKQAS